MPTNPHKKRYRKTIRDAHREYIRERKEIGYTNHPTYKQYSGFIVDFFKEIFKMILFDNFTFVTNIGTFTLAAEKKTFSSSYQPPVDIKETIDRRRKTYHINDHSHGYVYRLAWIKEGKHIKNIKVYDLQLSRYKALKDEYLGKRGIAKYIKDSATKKGISLPIPKTLYYKK